MINNTETRETDPVSTDNETAESGVEATPQTPPAPLTKSERADYEKLITRFKEIEGSWYESDEILEEIRERKLFRAKHKTFAAFCSRELGMTAANANRLRQTVALAQKLATAVVKPEKEAHVRPLLALKKIDDQISAYRMAIDEAKVECKPLTGPLVNRVVRKLRDAETSLNKKPSDAEPRPLTKADVITRIRRETGRYLERLEVEQLEEFEKAVAEFMAGWLENQLPVDEITALKVGGQSK